MPRIADALARHEADILVLSEYRGGEAAGRLRAALALLGYRYATAVVPPPGRTGVLIAARCALRDDGAVGVGLPEPCRMVSADFPDFRLVGIYMPNLLLKVPYWEALIAFLQSERCRPALAVGDFKARAEHATARRAVFRHVLLAQILDLEHAPTPDSTGSLSSQIATFRGKPPPGGSSASHHHAVG